MEHGSNIEISKSEENLDQIEKVGQIEKVDQITSVESFSENEDFEIQEVNLKTVMKITRKDCSRSLFISICSVIVISGILPITAFVYSDKIIENMVPMVELFK